MRWKKDTLIFTPFKSSLSKQKESIFHSHRYTS